MYMYNVDTTAASRGPLYYFSSVIKPISLSKTACVHNNASLQKREYIMMVDLFFIISLFFTYILDWLDPYTQVCMYVWINNHLTAKWVHCPRVSSHIIACHNFRQPVIWGTLLFSIDRFIFCSRYKLMHVNVTAT